MLPEIETLSILYALKKDSENNADLKDWFINFSIFLGFNHF